MMMASSSSFWASAGPSVVSAPASSALPIKLLPSSRRTILSWSLRNRHLANTILQRSDRQAVLAFANANARQGKGSSINEVMMVDPLEAKRLAAKQMQQIRAKEKLRRRRQAEAINGACAMIGLTAGLVVEGQTGKGILGQLAGYFSAIISFFPR